jgi:hypothetical protein
MRLKKGTEVLIRARVVDDCHDNRAEWLKGYIVTTSRGGTLMVNPQDILVLYLICRRNYALIPQFMIQR